ncbi:CMRF35-like molecule 9 isoform X7 [Choloepus didactylus]|uniref:CMRF35-like molecule 9 isoform X7 n=1 Tax=Choloepus didactylus TaxID=27675 RepID=UPI00189D47F2|nr:CMRF35-like molecule 9 isoform X7 [Choloepus didactylus]
MQLLLLWGCLVLPGYGALVGPKEISGFEGGTASLNCSYGEELKEHRKYWCRRGGILISRCSGTIYASKDGQEKTEGRVSIRDSPPELRLAVTLRNLTLQDAGTYWCGVSKLGLDETHLVSLLVFPGPCCPPSPTPSFRPLTTTSLQLKAKAWQTQPPELRISYPATQLHPTLAKGTGPSRSSSEPRVSIPRIRILAPVLVLLSLLLATALAALGSHVLRRRKEVQMAAETARKEKVDFLKEPPGNSWVPEYAVVNLVGTPEPTAPQVSPKPSTNPSTEIQSPSQTSEVEEASAQDPEGDRTTEPPADVSGEEPGFPRFTSV